MKFEDKNNKYYLGTGKFGIQDNSEKGKRFYKRRRSKENRRNIRFLLINF